MRSFLRMMIVLLAIALRAAAKEVTIKVDHKSFDPADVKHEKGDSVIFENTADMPGGHTVVAEDGTFASPALEKGKSWTYKFEKLGTWKIQLKEHPKTRGMIMVE